MKAPDPAFILSRGKDRLKVQSLLVLAETIAKLGELGVEVQRYKGLGEMDASELKDTTMHPQSRSLLRVELENMIQANQIFSTLMGSQVEPRRDFIQQHALEVNTASIDA